MVPINRSTLYIDIFARWHLPVVLCARTALGTINHSLLSIEALRSRKIEILGIAFIGERNSDSESAICENAYGSSFCPATVGVTPRACR
jgi:dethiobiotin synthetase